MKVLFFDVESSTGMHGDICEFGYLITNENFEIEEKENIYIDPNSKFKKRILDEILSEKEEFYKSKNDFLFFYSQIKEIFNKVDIVIGYSTVNDADYLNHECYNYDLPFINFKFYDVQKIIFEYDNSFVNYGLEKSLELFNIEKKGVSHNALDDANNTMRLLKSICNKLDISLMDLLELTNKYLDKVEDGIIESVLINHLTKEEKYHFMIDNYDKNNFSWDWQNILCEYYNQISINKKSKSKLCGKKFAFSKKIIINHYFEMFNIINMLAQNGAKVCGKNKNFNYFICSDEELNDELEVLKIKNSYQNVQLISYHNLLEKLCITESELMNLSLPSLNCITHINPYENRVKGCKIRKHIDKLEKQDSITYLKELFTIYNVEGNLC